MENEIVIERVLDRIENVEFADTFDKSTLSEVCLALDVNKPGVGLKFWNAYLTKNVEVLYSIINDSALINRIGVVAKKTRERSNFVMPMWGTRGT